MFIGDFNCKIDSKNRVVFPSGLKKQMGEDVQHRFVLKKDRFEPMLILYHIDEWQRQVDKIKESIDPLRPDHNKLFRGFYFGAAEITIDSGGRILLPKRLMDQVSISKDIVMAGRDMSIEIWDEKLYYENDISNEEYLGLLNTVLSEKKNNE